MKAIIVDKLPYDFILGRPDKEKYNLLSGRDYIDDVVLYHETHVTELLTSTHNNRGKVEQSSAKVDHCDKSTIAKSKS